VRVCPSVHFKSCIPDGIPNNVNIGWHRKSKRRNDALDTEWLEHENETAIEETCPRAWPIPVIYQAVINICSPRAPKLCQIRLAPKCTWTMDLVTIIVACLGQQGEMKAV
jgi:hypothetical protein